MNKELKNYYTAVENLTKLFCKRYFKDTYEYDVNDWVDGKIGEVICINEYRFNFSNIEYAIAYKATKKELFDYYGYSSHISFESYLKYYRGFLL